MPYRSDKNKLPRSADGRANQNLTQESRDMILSLRGKGWSYESIGEEVGVSRQTVKWVCDPEAYEAFKIKNKRRMADRYYSERSEKVPAKERKLILKNASSKVIESRNRKHKFFREK